MDIYIYIHIYDLPHLFQLFNLFIYIFICYFGAASAGKGYIRCLGFMFNLEGQDVGMGEACQALTTWHKDPEVGRITCVFVSVGNLPFNTLLPCRVNSKAASKLNAYSLQVGAKSTLTHPDIRVMIYYTSHSQLLYSPLLRIGHTDLSQSKPSILLL